MATTMKPLSADDRGALMIRIFNHHLKAICHNRIAIADILIDGHPGYDKMSDEALLEAARKQNVSTDGLDIIVSIIDDAASPPHHLTLLNGGQSTEAVAA